MHIHSLRLKNYQCHADTALNDLKEVTVLVGPNGGGKSALFDGIRTLSRVLSGPVAQAFGPPPFSFQSKLFHGAQRREMGFEAEFGERDYTATIKYEIVLGYTGSEDVDAPPSILREAVRIGDDVVFDRAARVLRITGMNASSISPDMSLLATIRQARGPRFRGPQILRDLARHVGSVVRYRLEPLQLGRPAQEPGSESDDQGPIRLGYGGENLASCLYWLSESKRDILDRIITHTQSVIPRLRGIDFNFVEADRVGFALLFDDARRAVVAPHVSSGTLLLLGLVTMLRAPTQPDIAAIEEPETGLTPDAVRLFLRLLVETARPADGRARSQFFFSSHSPFVLVDAWNNLAPDRSYIRRVRIHDGRSVVEDLQSVIDQGTSGAVLQRAEDGQRTILGLKTAEELMCGRFLPE